MHQQGGDGEEQICWPDVGPAQPHFDVESQWRQGPRTSAWDALWARIFQQVLPSAAADAGQIPENQPDQLSPAPADSHL